MAPDGLLSSVVGDRLVRTTPLNITVQKDFYRLEAITRRDAAILRMLLLRKETPSSVRRAHGEFVARFQLVSETLEKIRGHPDTSAEDNAYAKKVAIEIEEQIHSQIEKDAVPVLRALRSKDPTVIHSNVYAISFFNFVSQQYMRTKVMRDRIEGGLRTMFGRATARRIRNVYCYCIANNLGGSLYVDRHNFELVFVDSPPGQGLLTGDQPLVNLLATEDGRAPQEMVFYYPLAPNTGLIVAPRATDLASILPSIGGPRVAELNARIARNSERFLVAESDSDLLPYLAGVP